MMTLEIYGHVLPDMDAQAAAVIEAGLYGTQGAADVSP